MPINTGTVLVVGGAGYIGSHMVLMLKRAGFTPIVLDNLSRGHREALSGAKLIAGEMADRDLLAHLFTTHSFSAVLHFASYIEVAESMKNPSKYYQNNVAATLTLLDLMMEHQVRHFIFSSTAAVYGEPHYTPLDELHPLHPVNPYGRSKRMVEEIVMDYARCGHLHYAILRYFNAAGADPEGRLAERHHPESHLIPLVLQAAAGERDAIIVYGNDYATPDGTCIRDYVHVTDLCDAHLLSLQRLLEGGESLLCNLGTGRGYSVQQVIDAARLVTGCRIPTVHGDRRPGDPAILVANASRAMQELHWQPRYSTLETLITHAWQAMRVTA